MENTFNFCPLCGKKNIVCDNNRKWFCSDCGFLLYCNVAAACGLVLYDDFDNVLFEVRAKEPRKGYLAIPGGFIDADERAEEGIIRECQEELGFEPENISFICTYPNTYLYKNIEYKTCDMFFSSKLPSSYKDLYALLKTLHPQESEVSDLKVVKVSSLEDIEKIPFAFESSKKTLIDFIKNKKRL